ncbi:transcription-repair coupling factor [bacterium]|nr:transcription-repair coupling factor [bacterium]
MSLYNDYFKKFPKIQEILSETKTNDKTEISEATREITSLISLCLNTELDSNIVIVTPNIFHAQKIFDQLSQIIDDVYFYPKDDFISTELLTESYDFKLQRINTLKVIFQDPRKKIIVTCLSGVLSKVPRKESYISHIKIIKKETSIKPKTLIEELVDAGYERVYTVEKQGDVSIRGSIIDVFPINDDKAYRIDFFGNDIETIKVFDIESQRSDKEIPSITIMPKSEILFTKDEKEVIRFYINDKLSQNLTEKTKEKFEDDLVYLDETGEYSLLQKYMSIFIQDNYSFVDYIDKKIMVFYDYAFIERQELNINEQIYDYLSNFKDYFNISTFLNSLKTYSFEKEVYFTERKKFHNLKDIRLHTKDVISYEGKLDLLLKDLNVDYKNKTIIISLKEKTYEALVDYFKQNNVDFIETNDSISSNKINIVKDIPFISLDITEFNTLILTDDKVFSSRYQTNKKYKLSVETKRLKSISELKIGDYVVHNEYGIGKFLETKTMTLGNHTSDYIHIKYDKEQSVYIPVENLYVLSKYAGSESYVPKLSSLNSNEWKKAKASARKKVQELASRLLNLYSIREKIEGFKYLPDDDMQRQFESEFRYELTKDQAQAIKDVKDDMESGRAMDRLICGDVGFGKTEVALRAAFKAVLSGKQVAYLAPTTILARQHFYSFRERMDKYGVNTALVSRFVKPTVIKENLKNLERGTVDIIIGTHRLLSKDVIFKNLGLLIIDEEQRFGVEAKEKLKELKMNVDCLTLTATPIPRTLQMAITGIKNVSLIETAPKGRYPIQTYVLERNDYIVKDAIEREIAKSGQVFYLYNRVEDMDRIVNYVHSLVPDARISVIHGKMERNTIENTIEDFIEQKTDILISTTIIETGVDIPNANTLIVHDAERYGLSQLYQIKGRVGRSDKISYAYLMYEKNKHLTEDAQKRLQAIKDFAELGSGFKIAVRDLTTRGAGEILGSEQSGFMDKVGIDLYLKMLDEEIKKQKSNEEPQKEENIRVLMSRHIDKEYISDDYVLIEIHTKISKLNSKAELEELKQELQDRFGPVSASLEEYMYSKLTENLINSIDFERVEITEYSFVFVFSSEKSKTINAQNLFKFAYETSPSFSFYFKVGKIFVTYTENKSKILMYKNISKYLEEIKKKGLI